MLFLALILALQLCAVAPKKKSKNLPSVALCLITRDEEIDLDEWISYHHSIGVSGVIIFDDNSDKSALADPAIFKWARSGFIREYSYFMDEEAPNPQLFAYQACLEVYGDHFDFMGFIDTDEFVVLHNSTQLLPEFLSEYTEYGGVVLNEMFFGSSGHKQRPDGGILRNYKKCARTNLIKSFVMPSKCAGIGVTPHFFNYFSGHYAVDVHKQRVNEAWNPTLGKVTVFNHKDIPEYLYGKAYIYHFVVKSEEDFRKKMLRGSGDGMGRDLPFFHMINSQTNSECEFAKHRNVSWQLRYNLHDRHWYVPKRDGRSHQIIGEKQVIDVGATNASRIFRAVVRS